MTRLRLRVRKDNGEDISEEIYTQNGKRNGFGWSQYEIHWNGHLIGWLECGVPMGFLDGYHASVEQR